MWLKLIGLLSLQSLCLMQSAVDYIIRLEYMQQMDQGEYTDRRVSSTYIDVLQERHPACSPHWKVAPDYDYKADNSNSGAHYLEHNWSVGDHYQGTIPGKKGIAFFQIRKNQLIVCCIKIE
jgi:hypothetical protein